MGYVGSGVLWGTGVVAGTSNVMVLYGCGGIIDVGV